MNRKHRPDEDLGASGSGDPHAFRLRRVRVLIEKHSKAVDPHTGFALRLVSSRIGRSLGTVSSTGRRRAQPRWVVPT